MNDWIRARLLSSVVAAVVLTGTICGPVALYLHLTAEDAAVGATLTPPDGRAGVAGQFASLFVAGWLRGDDVTFFNPALETQESGLLVERVGAVRTIERGAGLFDVVVAANVIEYLEGSEEQFRSLGLRFYGIGVSANEDGDLAVLGPPAAVEAPAIADQVTPVIGDLHPATAPELAGLAETLDGFFDAYLTSQGDVTLFTSPNSVIGAVTPVPFTQVAVLRIGQSPIPGIDDPDLQLARVEIDAKSSAGSQLLDYSLVLAERDDRWEVSQVLHAPVVITRGDAE